MTVGRCAHMTYYERTGGLDNQHDARFDLAYRRLPLKWFYDSAV